MLKYCDTLSAFFYDCTVFEVLVQIFFDVALGASTIIDSAMYTSTHEYVSAIIIVKCYCVINNSVFHLFPQLVTTSDGRTQEAAHPRGYTPFTSNPGGGKPQQQRVASHDGLFVKFILTLLYII